MNVAYGLPGWQQIVELLFGVTLRSSIPKRTYI